jgi:hypothetical protein
MKLPAENYRRSDLGTYEFDTLVIANGISLSSRID